MLNEGSGDTELRPARQEHEGDGAPTPDWRFVILIIVSVFGFISKLLR
jgi:hypothetical protein